MKEYIAPEKRALFEQNALCSFDDFWSLEADPFEPINERRGGWSGAYEICLKDKSSGEFKQFFMKRQQGHNHLSPTHISFTRPTLEREFRTLDALYKAGVPIPKAYFFAKRRYQGKWQAVLVEQALVGYQPLNLLLREWSQTGVDVAIFRRIATALAKILRRLHDRRFQHNCMYTKHIMVNLSALKSGSDQFLTLIDLEKTRRRGTKLQCTLRDLYTLYASFARRHSVAKREYFRFFKAYAGVTQLDAESKKLWYQIQAFIRDKNETRGFIERQPMTPAIQFLSEH